MGDADRRITKCPGCKVPTEEHQWGFPSKYCQGKEKSSPKKSGEAKAQSACSSEYESDEETTSLHAQLGQLDLEEKMIKKAKEKQALREKVIARQAELERLREEPCSTSGENTQQPNPFTIQDLRKDMAGQSALQTPLDALLDAGMERVDPVQRSAAHWFRGQSNEGPITAPRQSHTAEMFLRPSRMAQEHNLRQRGSQEDSGRLLSSAIKPFQKRSYTIMNTVTKELKTVLAEKRGWKIFWLLLINIILTFVLFVYSGSTNSLALMAFSYLTVFDVLSLLTCLLSLWVSLQKPSSAFSFGYDRYEVLAVFSSTILTMFGNLFIFKECIERLLMPVEVLTDGLFALSVVGLFLHLVVTYTACNKPLNQVSKAAASNWLQDAVADLGHSICGFTPLLGKALIQRFDPIALLGIAGALSVLVTDALIDYNKSYIADSLCAMVMTSVIWATMLPLSIYSGQVLLQTCPPDVMSQIDKCLREASTLDGVLEFRNEHFWTVSFGRMAGSLHVRIRRDANEQMVLAHVINKLNHLVSHLTVQVFKDDWIRSTSGTKLANLASLPSTFHHSPSLPKIHQNTPQKYGVSSSVVNMPYTVKDKPRMPSAKAPHKHVSPLATGYTPTSKMQ